MPYLPDAVIGDAFRSQFAWDVLESLTEIGDRLAGHEGEAEGAVVLRDAFERAGARDATITEFEVPGWWRGSAELAVEPDAGRARAFTGGHELLGLPGSPEATVEGDLVDVGDGLPADFDRADLDGKIALVGSQNPSGYGRAINRIEKYARAREAGAAGFVYANDVTDGAVPPTGAVEFGRPLPGPIPAVGVSREVAARLRRSLAAGPVTATLAVECRNAPATCRNVEAAVGPDAGPEVLVTAHVDGHDVADGARDNAAGSALVAEIGRLLAMADLETRVRLVSFGGEETGLLGSTRWADTHDLDAVAAQVNLDGIGYTRNLAVAGMGPHDVFVEAGEPLHSPVRTSRTASPFNDHWPFVTRGVPAVTCRSTAGGEGQVVRYGKLEWGHTHADTLDKLDPRDLRDLAVPIAEAVGRLSGRARDIDRIPEPAVRAVLPDGLAEYLRLDDRWPW